MDRPGYKRSPFPAATSRQRRIATHYSKKQWPKARAAPMDQFLFLATARSTAPPRPSPARKAPPDRLHSRLPVALDRAVSRPACARALRLRSATMLPPRSIAQKKNGAVFSPGEVALLVRRRRPAPSAPPSNRAFPARLREYNDTASTGARPCPYNSSAQSAELTSVPRTYRWVCAGHCPESRAGQTL